MKIFGNANEETAKRLKDISTMFRLYVFRQVAISNSRDFEIAECENIIVKINIVLLLICDLILLFK